jgi:hypothetical protein
LLHLQGICSENSRTGCAERLNSAARLRFCFDRSFCCLPICSKSAAVLR